MTDALKKAYPAMKLLLVIAAMLCGCKKSSTNQQAAIGETFRFVWLADSRGDSNAHPVHTEALNPIISQIGALSPRPSFVIFGGDGAYRGYIKPDYTFQAFKDLFAPLTSNGIPLYTVMGNHELYYEHSDSGFILANQQQFQLVFSENPSNGPAGYEHLAYTLNSPGGSTFFVVLDAYYLTHDSVPAGEGGNIAAAQMSWLRTQVAQTKAIHKFLFIHTPYYYISNDPQEPSEANETYTRLWAFLDSNRFDCWVCGHSHLFSRKTIDSSVLPTPQTTPPTPAWQNNVIQLLNGTCGAGPDTLNIDPAIKISWNVHDKAKTYYYSVIDISGNTATVKTYGGYTGAYSLVDTFTITR